MDLAALSYFWALTQTSYITFRKQLRIDPFLLPLETRAGYRHNSHLHGEQGTK